MDFMLAVVLSTTFYWLGTNLDFDRPPDITTFPSFIAVLILSDLAFGILHYYSHTVPYLYKKHMVHHQYKRKNLNGMHQYKRKNLNGMASFHAEFLDSCIMNAGAWLSAAFLGLAVGYNHVAYMDFLYAAALSHVRYSQRQMNLMFFFEFDLFDLVFAKERLRCVCMHFSMLFLFSNMHYIST